MFRQLEGEPDTLSRPLASWILWMETIRSSGCPSIAEKHQEGESIPKGVSSPDGLGSEGRKYMVSEHGDLGI